MEQTPSAWLFLKLKLRPQNIVGFVILIPNSKLSKIKSQYQILVFDTGKVMIKNKIVPRNLRYSFGTRFFNFIHTWI